MKEQNTKAQETNKNYKIIPTPCPHTCTLNETRYLVQHESCECKCGLNESLYNSKSKWNHGECWCESKELNDWGSCVKD